MRGKSEWKEQSTESLRRMNLVWLRRRAESGLNVYLLGADFVLFVKLVPCSKQPRNILGIFDIILGNGETEGGKKK